MIYNYNKLTPFKKYIIQNFPYIDADFDSLNNYGLYCKVVEYLNKVIDEMNGANEQVEILTNAFNNLHDYVENYFANLDVQDEINQKLDEMATTGELQELISNIFDSLENEISAVASGSPAGVYATVSDLENDDPDHSRIYVVLADGKWYYYNTSNSTWTAGGTYQSSGIGDGTVTLNALSNDVKFNLNQRINNKDIYNLENEIAIDLTNNLINATIDSTTGAIETRTDNVYFATNNFYYVPENAIIPVVAYPSWAIRIYFYDKNFTYIKMRDISTSGSVTVQIINMIKSAKYIRFRINKQDLSTTTTSEISAAIKPMLVNIENKLTTNIGVNMVNPNKYISGYLNNTQAYPYQIQQLENTTYRTTFPIPIEANKSYFISRFRQFIILDSNLEYVNDSGIYADTSNYIFTAENDGYVVFSYNSTYLNTLIMAQSDSAVSYTPYKEYLPDYIDLSNLIESDSTNILYGKKYVALGDSFTHGDFSDSPTNDYTILSGLYQGQYKVYPYLIGNRNNMNVYNLAVNGMTITNVGGSSSNYLNDDILETIPEDVDYITIKIGINDQPNHENAPLGTIQSSDRTTFYGAWNYVLNYLISNYKNAKIGIIVTNGIDNLNYINAIIDVAKKYGLSYLNETTDEKVPLLIRTMRSDVSSDIKTLRNNEWEVLPGTNAHPNAKCHEYESTIIENFLRSL